jgi:hypothetical protein
MFSPRLTIPAVSELARRHRNAFLAFRRAVSMAFGADPSMAWDSMRLPPQSRTAMATEVLFFSAQAVQPSTRPRAPDELMIFMVRVGEAAGAASASAANEIATRAASEAKEARRRMLFLPIMVGPTLQGRKTTVEPRGFVPSLERRLSDLAFLSRRPMLGRSLPKGILWLP